MMLQGGPAGAAAGPSYRFLFYVRQQPSDTAAEDDDTDGTEEDYAARPPKRIAVTLPPPVRHQHMHARRCV